MLDRQATEYFQNRDQRNPNASHNRRYFRAMFAIAERILQMRKKTGLTQHELADKLATTQSTIARWETPGYTGYTLKKLFQIAEQLDYELDVQFIKSYPTSTFSRCVESGWTISDISDHVNKVFRQRLSGVNALNSREVTTMKETQND